LPGELLFENIPQIAPCMWTNEELCLSVFISGKLLATSFIDAVWWSL